MESIDPAQAALARARAAARNSPSTTPRPTSSSTSRSSSNAAYGRDPVTVGQAVEGMVNDRGWQERTSVASVTARWADIVGPDIADHATIERFDSETSTLVVRADSTAWATQLKLLSPQLMARLVEEVGSGVVTSLTVVGPTAPSWTKGPRTAPGRGPRDTYG